MVVALISGGLAWGLSHHNSSGNGSTSASASESAAVRLCLGVKQVDDGTAHALEAAIAHDHVAMAHAVSLIKLGSTITAVAARDAGVSVTALTDSVEGAVAVTALSEAIRAASAQAGCTHLPATSVTPGTRRS
jgi:hypothetical protein